MEIKIRKDKFQEEFLHSTLLFGQSLVIIRQKTDGANKTNCTREELAPSAADLMLPKLPDEAVKGLYALSADDIKNAFMTKFNVNLMNMANYVANHDAAFCEDIAKDLIPLLFRMSNTRFDYHAEKE